MSDSQKKKWRNISIHIAVWIVYMGYELITVVQIGGADFNPVETVLSFGLYAGLFYTNTEVLLPYLFGRKRYALFAITTLIAIAAYIATRYLLKVFLIPWMGFAQNYPFSEFRLFLAEALWRGGYFLMLSFGYWFAKNLIEVEKKKKLLEKKTYENEKALFELEKNLKSAEIAILKNQINPHFLFNTLNFFFDQVRPHSEKLAEGIMLLSRVMRYSIRENGPTSKTMLADEVAHLKNFININQLRFENSMHIQFEVQGNLEYRMIAPLVLITFVENAFKYGDLFEPEHPVSISLQVLDDNLDFTVINKKKTGPIEASTGIGLENTINRLRLIYKDRHSLSIKDTDDFYRVDLNLKL